MKSVRFLDRQVSASLTALALLISLVVPGVIPAFASAAQVTSRSITLSNSAAGATGVTYEVEFTVGSSGAAGAYMLEFCSNSPIIGSTCTAPTGMDTTDVATSTGSTTVSSPAANRAIVTKTIANSSTQTVVLTGIDNPSSAGTLYARIVTYADATDAATYDDTDLGTDPIDDGGVAMAITNQIGVTAAVRETMTFCVASAAITENCGNASGNLPTIELGEGTGDAKALSPSAVSTASIFTQLSTNAAGGAVVNLKSNATDCGGLKRLGAPSACDIGPADAAGISNGQPEFGIRTGTSTATGGVGDATGELFPVGTYNSSTYFMNYVAGNGTGVTSTYGDPFLDTNELPINNQNMELTFGASASNNTPAGTYTANLSLIASGTF